VRLSEDTDFAAFVEGAWVRLWRSAYAIAGDRQLAEDALQSALVRAYASWPRVRTRTLLGDRLPAAIRSMR
jgi:DNA-directed RNA polymerase specialized sigma24 family protein